MKKLVIPLTIFCAFAVFYLKEELKRNYIVGFLMIAAASLLIFKKW